MNPTKKIVLVLGIFLCLAGAGPAIPAKQSLPVWEDPGFVGGLAYLKGSVQAKRVKSPSWLKAYVNMPDYLLDQIETAHDSTAALEFKDGTQVGINQDTKVLIDSSTTVKDVTRRTLLKRVILNLGTLWCKVTRQEQNESFTVETKGGVLGIRGTEFLTTTQGNDEMTVDVLEGTVATGKDPEHLDELIHEGEEAVVRDGKIVSTSSINRGTILSRYPGLDPVQNIRSSLLCESAVIGGDFSYPSSGLTAVSLPCGKTSFRASLRSKTLSDPLQKDEVIPGPSHGEREADTGDPSTGFLSGIRWKNTGNGPADLTPSGTVKTYPPVFSWSPVPGAAGYRVIVARKPIRPDTQPDDLVWVTRVENNFVVYPEYAPILAPDVPYYWTVVGVDDKGLAIDMQSESVQFVIPTSIASERKYPVPVLNSPANSSTTDDLPVFSYEAFPGASRYQILIGTQLKGKTVDLDHLVAVLNASDTSARYDLSSMTLEPGGVYYWSMRPLDAAGRVLAEAPDANGFSVSSSNLSAIGPRPVFPVKPESLGSIVHFEWRNWTPGIHGFELVVSENADMSSPLFARATSKPWYNLKAPGLTPGKTYYWKVSTINQDGEVENSGAEAAFQILSK